MDDINIPDLNLWFKDRVLKDATDRTDYLDNSVNIQVDQLVSAAVFEKYSVVAAQYCTEKAYNNFPESQVTMRFYQYMLKLTNQEKLLNLYNAIKDIPHE